MKSPWLQMKPPTTEHLWTDFSNQSIRKAQAAFSGVAEEMGVYNEDDIQA